MKKTCLPSLLISILSTIFVCGNVFAAQDIISPLVKDPPVLDGTVDDAAWKPAVEHIIRDMRMDVNVRIKSVHTNDMLFLYVRFPDQDENALQKPWVWNKEFEMYQVGDEREDVFNIRWSMEENIIDISSFSDDNFTADLWYWKANRTNPIGYADDKYHILSTLKQRKSLSIESKTGKQRYLLRLPDEGTAVYEKQIFIDYKGGTINQYKHNTPNGSRADVKAKGTWKDGFWTIEFARKFNTGHADDVQFDPASKKKYLFGISIKSLYGEPIDNTEPNLYGQGRISEPLYLIFK
jgi:hypothetical protein